MAATKVVLSSTVVLLLSQLSALDGNEQKELKICGSDAINSFGDSLADTGNAKFKMPRTVVELEYIGNNLIATGILHYTFLFGWYK